MESAMKGVPVDPLHLDDEENITDEESSTVDDEESSAAGRPYYDCHASLDAVEKFVAEREKELETARLRLRQCHLLKAEMEATYRQMQRAITSRCSTRVERVVELTRVLRGSASRQARLDCDIAEATSELDDAAERAHLARIAQEKVCISAKIASLSEDQ